MIGVLSEMVRNIVVLIIFVTILDLVLPRTDFRPFVNMVVGLVLMLMLLSPLRSVLQFPGALDPVLEMRLAISEREIEDRQAMLEQMNWDLTMERYREMVEERVVGVLGEGGLALSGMTLDLEEDVNHMEFGQPRGLSVTATVVTEEARPGQVERVRIEIGESVDAPEAASRDAEMERKLAEALGMGRENVEVYVLNQE
jgi:stage III sporulation protein AF